MLRNVGYPETMDIMLHIGQDGRFALTCDGVFDSLIESIDLHCAHSMLSIKFIDSADPVMMNCPIDPGSIQTLMEQRVCAIGFFLGRELAGAVYVPFNVHLYESDDLNDSDRRRVLQ